LKQNQHWSRNKTPEAFDNDGRLMASLHVNLESAVVRNDMSSRDVLAGTQTVQVWASCAYGYTEIKAALRAVRRALHGRQFTPDEDPVRWTDTRWASTSPELVEEAERTPTMFSRFDITYTETP
jgi:hypothetical protein